TQHGILNDFEKHFVEKGLYTSTGSYKEMVLQINKVEPSETFAIEYLKEATAFATWAKQFRENAVLAEKA
ncbi:MAG: hypothetical protein ABIR18_04605, partial [Chitinophagaceae bacterium]